MEKLGRNDACWCKSGRKYKACHMAFDEKILSFARQGHEVPKHSLLKTKEQVEKIKESAKINMACLDAVEKEIRPGMTTQEIDDIVNEITTKMGGIPAQLHYEGFPKSVCTSINEVICHGIPSKKVKLCEGDILTVDCSTILDGYFSDSARCFLVGEVSPEKKKLVEVARECMLAGLKEVVPWHFLGDMAAAVNETAKQNGYSVVRDIGGHGCGLAFHEDPFVSYVADRGTKMLMVPGMVFTIEPMVNMGRPDFEKDTGDGWTIRTKDRLPSAQWEIQVLVTEDGAEVLSS